jgi:hypothetical protein
MVDEALSSNASQDLGLGWWFACHREHFSRFAASAGDCLREPEENWPIGILSCGFTPRSCDSLPA